ncbi:hypothetical protein Q9251_02165 [Alkalihalobacillus macyae]|uniref:hypothetical protein n=1 Tax=Guptibacillus hwajinpoensis TaxID=208199 RepID=UPI00273CEF01|nr:hypothetical protein [Alkalihalobacillus macyae]MDP4549684.1 hypothetical protein [Alkalihalobacillus macyae]
MRFLLFIAILLLLAACNGNTHSEDYDNETKEKAKASVEEFITSNYEEIDSVEMTRVYQSEMGGLNVDGTVNGGAARFSAGIESDFSVGSLGLGEGFPEMKEACKERICGS